MLYLPPKTLLMKNYVLALICLCSVALSANPGDTMHVISHNAVTVVTDPSTGANGYKRWATFPSVSTPVRKIVSTLTFKCAPGMQCGAWDYLDHLVIRRVGGQAQPSKDIDIVRFITPYGNTFTSTWNFSWHMDVTDYSMFLRDSVEIEYIHTGYEGSNVGWQITVDFMIVEGTPVADPISFTQLWQGNFTYGDASNDIENYLKADTVNIDSATAYTKLRLLHTGHGADANDCSEFCDKTRTIKFDGVTMNTRHRWKPCGGNALYPQGGTWVYDRASWCPGDIVQPDFTSSTSLTPGPHTFDMDMQAYTVSSPSAVEAVDGQLFQYKAPNSNLDASIEEVYQPSSMKEYNRINPICNDPKILLRNNGSAQVNSISLKYGMQGSTLQSYTWNGALNFGDTSSVALPGYVIPQSTVVNSIFKVFIDQVNGSADQYPLDDSASVKITSIPPTYDTVLLILFKTNAYLEDSYYITDQNGTVVWSRVAANLQPNTSYFDTVHLAPGCYDISMYDSGGDGLSFWANTAQGSGIYRLKRMNQPSGIWLKIFGLDFGNFIHWSFYSVPNFWAGVNEVKQDAVMDIYPNPVSDRATVEYSFNGSVKPVLQVMDGLGRVVKETKLTRNDDFYTLDFSDLSKGFYYVKLVGGSESIVKKVVKE